MGAVVLLGKEGCEDPAGSGRPEGVGAETAGKTWDLWAGRMCFLVEVRGGWSAEEVGVFVGGSLGR